ncbi:hypothetical protein Ga0466249_000086 [Sporomusaceae bacterium BoRhaA]|uniref:S-layer homology domain-containing protein n=1 Tax=Pelorhabdus rhamnosifermentans TaxID=2772457 RepID=UPI001C062091|nr:S-layer homology domain-containing protein [Pelorhabdus rhamnosifermentans]MBU2699007.1 hypothetical protein [Pelorhabdus rhamnosifermentans]
MKKKIALGLALALATSVGTTAFAAAANPFTDVPTKHWSYGAVQQLAKAGIIDGYNDGTFKGDKTITRYEMAVLVAKAMAKEDKADAAQKATIDKLAAEFSSELDNLGVRVTNLENKVGNIKWDGYARIRAEQTPSGSNPTGEKDTVGRTRVRLNMTAPLDTDWTFKGRIQYDSQDNNNLNSGAAANDNGKIDFASAYVTGKAFGLDTISVGRAPVWLGQGFISDDKGSAGGVAPDGIIIGKNIGVTNLQIGYNRSNALYKASSALRPYGLPTDLTTEFAGFTAPIGSTLIFDASYLKDKDSHYYKTTAAGLTYTGLQNFTISGEYGENKSKVVKDILKTGKAKAYQAKVKWMGADKSKVNTWGTWVAYNKFEAGFDPADFTTTDFTTYQTANLQDGGLKGTEVGVEYVPFKNSILTFKYEGYKTSDIKANDFNANSKGYIAQLEVFF